jgi:hypothetical protein
MKLRYYIISKLAPPVLVLLDIPPLGAGSSSKTLLIVHVSPSASNLSRTLSTLSFSARAKNAELSLGNRDTIKKWKDVANDSRKELHDKEKEVLDLRQEVLGLKLSLKEANDQCTLLFNEVQKAWRVSSTLQADLKVALFSLSAIYTNVQSNAKYSHCFLSKSSFTKAHVIWIVLLSPNRCLTVQNLETESKVCFISLIFDVGSYITRIHK